MAEHRVGVRHRRLLASAAVAGRAGMRARTLRADAESPRERHVGDRPAAGADRDHVERGHAHLVVVRQRAPSRDGRVAAAVQRHVGARPAHVEAEHVAPPDQLAEEDGGAHAACRPREDRLDRAGGSVAAAHQAAV